MPAVKQDRKRREEAQRIAAEAAEDAAYDEEWRRSVKHGLVEVGKTTTWLAHKVGMSRNTFYSRMRNPGTVTRNEDRRIMRALRLESK